MDPAGVALLIAALLCALVAGFLFAFASVVMPGLRALDDGAFLRAFQVVDRVIQNNQPVFMAVWVGSVLALVGAAVLGFGRLHGAERALLLGAVIIYLGGVQLPTALINVPLNNRLQTLVVADLNEPELRTARQAFEARWNAANRVRTVLATLVAAILLVLLLRL